jgi:hypothetical protein
MKHGIHHSTVTAPPNSLTGLPTNGQRYEGDVRMRLYYNYASRNGTYDAMDILHREFMEHGRTLLSTDGGNICVVAFRGQAFIVPEGRPGVIDYHMPEGVVLICENSEEYKGPGISPDDYDEAQFVINPNGDALVFSWYAPEVYS